MIKTAFLSRLNTTRVLRFLSWPTIVLVAVFALTPSRAAACPASIVACGCTITTHGSYAISPPGAVLSSPGSFCVKVASPNVTLDLSHSKITGPGAKTASNGIQVLALTPPKPLSVPVSNVAIISTGGQSEIDAFGVGIRSAGPNTKVLEVNANSNGTGMLFSGAGPMVMGASVTGNNDTGIQINSGASGAVLVTIGALLNLNGPGVWINGANGVFMSGIGADVNGSYGVWLDAASGNTLESFSATDNAIAGVYLGCAPAGPNGTTCASVSQLPSSFNNIFGNVVGPTPANVNNSSLQSDGVAIGLGNGRNHVVLVDGTGNKKWDAFDENPNCGSNVWVNNGFAMRNRTAGLFCIGNGP